MSNSISLTKGQIFQPLVHFTLPILLAMCLQAAYGAVDLAVVGWFATPADVSAVNSGAQLLQGVTVIIMGLSMGTTIILGHKLGGHHEEEAAPVIGSALCFFAVLGVVFTFIGNVYSAQLAALMNAPPEALRPTISYIRICLSGAIFIIAFNLVGSIFRGLGDSKTPLIAVSIACVCNIFGDLFLVGYCGMATAGAALATVASQLISVIVCMYIVKRRGLPFPFSLDAAKPRLDYLWQMVKLGFPLALQDALVAVSFLVILIIINGLGVIVSAGVGVAEKICGFIMLVPSSFGQSLSAFVAINAGAKEDERAQKALLYGIGASLCVAVVMGYMAWFQGPTLAKIFAGTNQEVIWNAAEFLKAYAIDTFLTSIMFCMCGYFNGYGKTKFVMLQGIIGAFCVRIPVSYFMSLERPVSVFHIAMATPSSSVVQIILCLLYYKIFQRWLAKSRLA
jgi:putative MATE family efflux protein